ncbi:hypothetical protein ACWEQA_35660 [Nocardia sp. NPDC004085]
MTTFATDTTTGEPDADFTDTAIDIGENVSIDAPPEATQRERPAHGQVAGELLWLDPAKLESARNRPLKPIDPEVAASIREHGNFIPLVVIRTEDDGFAVWDGWHRVVLLRETPHMAKCAVYPLDTSAEQLDIEAERIALQFNSGAHRYTQSEIDRADAVAQMLELGFNLTETRRKLVGITSEEVRSVKKVTRSQTATQALHDSDLNLVQAAAAAEHFGDDPDAIDELIAAAADGQFEHVLAQMLEERADIEAEERLAAAYSDAVTSFTTAGFMVLELPLPDGMVLLENLIDADRNTPTPDSVPIEHLGVVLVQQAIVEDTQERIPVDLIDERTEQFPDDDPDPGKFHISEVTVLAEFEPAYYCTDLEAAGLHRTDFDDAQPETDEHDVVVIAEDPDQREARLARERAEAERRQRLADEAAAKRAQATILNRYARAATKVRREFLVTNLFNGQKTIPAGSWELIGRVLQHPHTLTAFHASDKARELGAKVPNSPSSSGMKARDNHGALRTLLRVVAAMEASLQPTNDHPDYWRRVNSLMGDYMGFLTSSLGYLMAPVERVLTGELTIAQVLGGITTPSATATAGEDQDPADEQFGEDADPDESDTSHPADDSADIEEATETDDDDLAVSDHALPDAA